MDIVYSIEQLHQKSAEIRSWRLGFITNFYLDSVKHGIWISNGHCKTECMGKTLFIIKTSPVFWNVFYCSTTLDDFRNDLSSFIAAHPGITMMFDIVGKDSQCHPMVELLKGVGCKEAASLVRMTRMADPLDYSPDSSVRVASMQDIPQVSHLLHKYFNDQLEQIPYDEELSDLARMGHILLCEENGTVSGFSIFEMNNTTLTLRYWFTHPDFRQNKVGSRLLRRVLEEGRGTKRQLLWVIQTNDNAIQRYKHYDFKEENMYDYVMQYN